MAYTYNRLLIPQYMRLREMVKIHKVFVFIIRKTNYRPSDTRDLQSDSQNGACHRFHKADKLYRAAESIYGFAQKCPPCTNNLSENVFFGHCNAITLIKCG